MLGKRTRKPTSPGEVFLLDVLEPLNMTVSAAATQLGVSRKHLGELCKGKARLTPDIANKFAMATDTTVMSWLAMQTALDVWDVEHNDSFEKIEPFAAKVA